MVSLLASGTHVWRPHASPNANPNANEGTQSLFPCSWSQFTCLQCIPAVSCRSLRPRDEGGQGVNLAILNMSQRVSHRREWIFGGMKRAAFRADRPAGSPLPRILTKF